VRPEVLPGQMALDERFTLSQLQSVLDNPVLHIASHFRFVPGSDASFLLLGDGSHLTLRDIRARGIRFNRVDLLTLSACETAVGGGHNENGLEVEGLGVLAQKQGARAVLATLWPVADASTGLLMQRFYQLRRKDGTTKVEALRQAQLALLRGAAGDAENPPAATERGAARATPAASPAAPAFPADPARRYAHPYFWAPFILMGNWL
jgi:CHAT domain-containing protein